MAKHLSFYGSHDSSICFSPAPGEYRIYEFERLLKKRYCNLSQEENWREHVLAIKRLIENEYGNQEWGSLFYGQVPDPMLTGLREIFGFQHTEELSHHLSHAAGALYQSPFEKALIISYDSGGNEMESGVETFCIFTGDRGQPMNHTITRLANIPLDAAGAFTLLAVPISEITKEDFYSKYLSYAGKCMGLAAFGNIHHDWLPAMTAYYYRPVNEQSLKRLGEDIGLDFSTINTISGQTAYDMAATSQYVFEQVVINAIMPFVERYQLPVILTGGGALNVLLNERLRTMLPYPVFVPVNPNDCGLSFGMMCLRNPPTRTVDTIYNGVNILDVGELPQFVEKHGARRVTVKELARILCAGKIVGVMRGNSECGPRALGNRSILCWPGDPGMKDRLNQRIKYRENFRPFSPVCRAEDVETYFNFQGESPFMSFAPAVREPYKAKIPAVVHHDGTARVQTIRKDQNDFLHNLLSYVDVINDIGILLNTSFNIKGKPILTTVEDAIDVWLTTELDAVYIEGYLFEK